MYRRKVEQYLFLQICITKQYLSLCSECKSKMDRSAQELNAREIHTSLYFSNYPLQFTTKTQVFKQKLILKTKTVWCSRKKIIIWKSTRKLCTDNQCKQSLTVRFKRKLDINRIPSSLYVAQRRLCNSVSKPNELFKIKHWWYQKLPGAGRVDMVECISTEAINFYDASLNELKTKAKERLPLKVLNVQRYGNLPIFIISLSVSCMFSYSI